MQIALVSLFPEMFAAISDHGVTGRAVRQGLLQLSHRNPRDFTSDRHRTVDDRPYGGGPGMVMMIDPLQQAIAAARAALRKWRAMIPCCRVVMDCTSVRAVGPLRFTAASDGWAARPRHAAPAAAGNAGR